MEIKEFIINYTSSDFDRIKFDWNGKHGDDLEDPNMDFRINVCECVIKDFSIAPDELILDLYEELSKSSKETWGVYRNYHLIAQEVLNRGRVKYLVNYLKGATQSFDTIIASGRVKLEEEEKREIIDHVESRRDNDPIGENPKYIELALRRFAVNNENGKEVK
ncbi:MAG: hypothetical protein ACRBG0_25520 [Lewinella sp.]|uniref:hypothetical protein n=1 Tax=Lewinella sp. TaxID=2004506 RepID=UPI003D6B5C80